MSCTNFSCINSQIFDFTPLEKLFLFYNHYKPCAKNNTSVAIRLFNDFLSSNAQKFLDEQIRANNVNSANRKK